MHFEYIVSLAMFVTAQILLTKGCILSWYLFDAFLANFMHSIKINSNEQKRILITLRYTILNCCHHTTIAIECCIFYYFIISNKLAQNFINICSHEQYNICNSYFQSLLAYTNTCWTWTFFFFILNTLIIISGVCRQDEEYIPRKTVSKKILNCDNYNYL